MKRLSFYSFLCAVLLMSVNVFGQFAGGNGTLEDPYQVNDASQFNAIANSNAFFVQIADITFGNNTDFPQIDFGGNYDGQGYKIIARGNKTQPLFGTVTGTITGVVVEMDKKTVAAILCNTLNGGTISYCNIKGEVAEATAGAKAGGIVNTMNSGLVEYCCFQGKVTAKGAGAYAGGICAIQNGGEIKGSMVAFGSELKADDGATVSGIANGSNSSSQVTSCYCQVNPKGNGTKNAIAPSGVTITNSYPNTNEGTLSGQALANYLNNGLDPEAFVVVNGKVVSVASSLSPLNNAMGIYRSRKDGDFHKATTWTYEAVPNTNTRQFIISTGRKVTLRNTNYISGASIIVEDGGKVVNEVQGDISGASIIVRDGGNFINNKNVDVTATMEKNITANQWNFIGFPVRDNAANGYGVALLAAVEGDIWALRYDYDSNTWDNNYLHWYEDHYDYVKAGNGIFAYPDTNYTLSIYGTLNNADLTVTNTITAIGNLRWMALANPYPAEIKIDALINQAQGHVVYLYNGATFYTENKGTIKAGQGFFVNMQGTNNSFTFRKGMIKKSVSAEREFVSVSVSTDGYKVPVLFAQNDDATDGYDIYDANKMFGNGTVAEPYLICEGIELCKEEVLSSSYTAIMNIKSSESRSVEIVADNIPEGYSLTLIDGAVEVVMNQGDVYTTDIAEGENADRFKLLITKNNVSIADVAEAESIRVVNNNRSIRVYGGKSVRTEVYNALGQKVYETSDRVFDLNNVASGAYILKVSDGKTVNSAKIVVE